MKVVLTNNFERVTKKLHPKQLVIIQKAIEKIKNDPFLGKPKVGDLAGIRVHKLHVLKQLFLLAYIYYHKAALIKMVHIASHENFYTNLNKQLKNDGGTK